MGTNSGVEWCNHSWSTWIGCDPVSEGCENCYAKAYWGKMGIRPGEVRRAKTTFNDPIKKNRAGEYKWKAGETVFVCPLSDFWHPNAPIGCRNEAFQVMDQRRDLTFILLTKRPEEMLRFYESTKQIAYIVRGIAYRANLPAPNHIHLVTIENQARADERIPPLLELKAKHPHIKIGVSIEPMLGPVDLTGPLYAVGRAGTAQIDYLDAREMWMPRLDWVIVGGESGPGARPMHPAWVRRVRDDCQAADVPFFFKQWGAWREVDHGTPDRTVDADGRDARLILASIKNPGWITEDGRFIERERDIPRCAKCRLMERVGKDKAGRVLDGREWSEFPKFNR